MTQPTLAGGVATLPATMPAANATRPTAWTFVCEWVSDAEPRPVDLQIETERIYPVGVAPSGFPPLRPLLHAGGTEFEDEAGQVAIVRVELGQGPNARTLYCDLKSGRFALGSQTRVRVSMARWQTSDANYDTNVQIGISETDGSGEYLTYTCVMTTVLAGNVVGLQFPPGAAWYDFYSEGDFQATQLGSEVAYAARLVAQSPPVYTPPSSPIPVTRGDIVFENVGTNDATLTVVVWVR